MRSSTTTEMAAADRRQGRAPLKTAMKPLPRRCRSRDLLAEASGRNAEGVKAALIRIVPEYQGEVNLDDY